MLKANESFWLGHTSFVLTPPSPFQSFPPAFSCHGDEIKPLVLWRVALRNCRQSQDKGEKIWERVPSWIGKKEEKIACRKDRLPAGEELMLDRGSERIREGRQIHGACGLWWIMWAKTVRWEVFVLPHGTLNYKLKFTITSIRLYNTLKQRPTRLVNDILCLKT